MLTLDQLAAEVTRATGADLLAVFASPAAPGDVAHRVRRDDLFAFGQGQKCFAFGVAGNPACLGDENTAGGFESMGKVTGAPGDGRNTSWGSGSLHELTNGTINTAYGYNCCYHLQDGTGNTGTGAGTLGMMEHGSFNSCHGSAAMENVDWLGEGRHSSHNAVNGYGALYIPSGYGANYCVVSGSFAGMFVKDSWGHVLLGYQAGGQALNMEGICNVLAGYQTTIEAEDTAHAVALGDMAVARSNCLTVGPNVHCAYLPLVITSRTADVSGFLGNSQMAYWLEDDPAGAAVHFVAKDSTGNVWQARLPLSR